MQPTDARPLEDVMTESQLVSRIIQHRLWDFRESRRSLPGVTGVHTSIDVKRRVDTR
jgi:hypothetical protein